MCESIRKCGFGRTSVGAAQKKNGCDASKPKRTKGNPLKKRRLHATDNPLNSL